MILLELFDSKPTYEVLKASPSYFKTRAEINNRVIVFTAEQVSEDGIWEVSFAEKTDNAVTYAGTNKGKPFTVLTMVKASLKEFYDRYHPQIVQFTADVSAGTARANIYSTLVHDVLKDYSLVQTKGTDHYLFVYKAN